MPEKKGKKGGAKRVYGNDANNTNNGEDYNWRHYVNEFATALSNNDAAWVQEKIRETPRRLNVDQVFDVQTPKINPSTPQGGELVTPLLYACAEGYDAIANVLVEGGANKFARTNDGNTLLHFSCFVYDDYFLRYIADHRVYVDTPNAYGQTPLMYAAFSASAPNVEFLLQRGGDPNAVDAYGWTPLYYAVFYKQADAKWRQRAQDTVAALIRGGAHVTPEAIQVAQDYGEPTIAKFMRSRT
jgi:hypothetical protein